MHKKYLFIPLLLASTGLLADDSKPIQIQVQQFCRDKIFGTTHTPSFLLKLRSSADELRSYSDCLKVMEPYFLYDLNDQPYAKQQISDEEFRAQGHTRITSEEIANGRIQPNSISTEKYTTVSERSDQNESGLDTLPSYTTIDK